MVKIFAEDLKSVREEKKLTLRNIAQQTRLSITALENLENGDFTFQPQPYIRAFLKQYINSLGLDVEETLFDYDLARSGKYKSKRQNNPTPIESKITDKPEDRKEEKINLSEKGKEIANSNEIIIEEKKAQNLNRPEGQITSTASVEKEFTSEKKFGSKLKLKPPEDKKNSYTIESHDKKNIFSSFLNSPVVRNIALIIFVALVLLGIYSLLNILFFGGSKDKPEVIRQNFDDVVKEQEKKILGKRTPEEIQDSIKRVQEELASSMDSITLKITALNSGTLFLVTDSVDYNKPEKIEYQKNQVGVFKARKTFYISSSNTGTFRAAINDKPIKFDNTSVSKVKITKEGLSK
jgi:transcriptional regulator with XRE-family HTH domain